MTEVPQAGLAVRTASQALGLPLHAVALPTRMPLPSRSAHKEGARGASHGPPSPGPKVLCQEPQLVASMAQVPILAALITLVGVMLRKHLCHSSTSSPKKPLGLLWPQEQCGAAGGGAMVCSEIVLQGSQREEI